MAGASDMAAGIADEIARRMARSAVPLPVGVSSRHLHLSQRDLDALFGPGAALVSIRPLGQPGQFACEQTVDLQGPKGAIRKVRVLGPVRPETQVEVSRTDAIALGIEPPVRQSGDLRGAASIKIAGPKGAVEAPAAIVAQRHIHLHTSDAARLGLKDNEIVRVRTGSDPRPAVFENVVARVSEKFALEYHLDTDEANAAWVKTGDKAYLC